MGYGVLASTGLLRDSLDKLGLGPAPHHGHRVHVLPDGFRQVRGLGGRRPIRPSNPLVQGFHERFVARYGGDPPLWPNAIPILVYDTACGARRRSLPGADPVGTGTEGRAREDSLHDEHDRRPRTHIVCSPYEHGMFRGDWLLYGRVTDGKLEFEGLFETREESTGCDRGIGPEQLKGEPAMPKQLDGRVAVDHRRGARDRAEHALVVRARGRQGRGERPGRQRETVRARTRRPPSRWSTRSPRPAARRSPTPTTSPTSTARSALIEQAVDAFGDLARAREQRRHPARPHARQHGARRMGRDHEGAPAGPLRDHPSRGCVLA